MASHSPPPTALGDERDNNISPFRALLEGSSKQRSAALSTASPQPASTSRPSSTLPSGLLEQLTPPHMQQVSPRPKAEFETAVSVKKESGEKLLSGHDESPLTPRATPTPAHTDQPSRVRGTSPCSPHSAPSSSDSAAPQQFCLRWNNYQSNLTSVFDQLLQNESFVDVTLACDGRSIKAHKMVLSACSPYFQTLFSETPCQHPIVIMRDVYWADLKAIVEFMYKGEINVSQEQIGPLLRIAEMLKVRGLADVAACESANLESTAEAHAEKATKLGSPMKRESYSPSAESAPQRKGARERERDGDNSEFLSFAEPEKKLRLSRSEWDYGSSNAATTSGSNSNLELRLSPLQHQQPSQPPQQQQRNVRKRRWPSTDTLFNPPTSPLSGLIAAERAERERERERTLLSSPMPGASGGNSGSGATPVSSSPRLTPSILEGSAQLELPSPTPTPAPSLLHQGRSSVGAHTPSPHLQHQQSASHAHQQQQHGHRSHRASPASAHPSSAPSPASLSGRSGDGASTSGATSDSRYQLGAAQAAAMAAAAAQMDLGMGMPHSTGAPPQHASHHGGSLVDDLEIRPGIAEMIREEERAKMLENSHAWMGASSSSIADSYQYQLQSMWQKCWNTNQNLMHHLRFRERGPLKSWRPETMAEAIFSVLKEGLSLSQAARKYDIPYPTFVLYANRVHNMLGPSIDGGPDLRPKGRGRPQRILLGIWPDEHIKGVIKTVVFRDSKDLKDDSLTHMPYGRHSPVFPFQDTPMNYPGVGGPCPNGMPTTAGDQLSQEATAAAVAAVAQNIRQQMQMAAAAQHQHAEGHAGANLFNIPPHLQPHLAAGSAGVGSGGPMSGPGPGGIPLPKASISPALSSASNPSASSLLGARHASSPCGSGLPSLPPNMAAALHMVGGPGGRCDASSMLSQQQQHQLQQLHLQQQHALHQQQQQQQQHPLGYGASSLAHPSSSASATAISSAAHQQQQQQSHSSGSATSTASSTHASSTFTKPKSTSPSSSHERRRSSPSSEATLASPLTELGLDLGYKSTRSYSPSRLFADDIAELVGAVTSNIASSATGSTGSTDAAAGTSTAGTSSSAPASSSLIAAIGSSSSASSNISSSDIKIEPIPTGE